MYFADYPIHLLEIVLTTDEALEERQMACVLLKKYISTHWSPLQENFIDPIISEAVKTKIRSVLPMGLSDVHQKIRTTAAVSLSYIAEQDYPGKWPEMITMVKSKLASSQYEDVNGAVMFVDECSRIFSSASTQLLAADLYENLHIIIQNEMVSFYFSFYLDTFN